MTIGSALQITAADAAEAQTPFAAYAPLLYQSLGTTKASIARTITRAVWLKRNGLTVVEFDLVAGATSTGGCGVQLPVAAIARTVICGTLIVMGASAPATQCFGAFMHAGLDTVGPASVTGGFLDIISGQTIRAAVMYQS